jgi:hypothetical protein
VICLRLDGGSEAAWANVLDGSQSSHFLTLGRGI